MQIIVDNPTIRTVIEFELLTVHIPQAPRSFDRPKSITHNDYLRNNSIDATSFQEEAFAIRILAYMDIVQQVHKVSLVPVRTDIRVNSVMVSVSNWAIHNPGNCYFQSPPSLWVRVQKMKVLQK